MPRRALGALGSLCLLLAMASGCGDDSSGTEAASTSSPSETPSATQEATSAPSALAMMTLKEICPQVEAALPGGMIPKAEKLASFISTLQTLATHADLEAQNAIPLLLGPSQDLYDVVAAGGQGADLTDALGPFIDGISAFATRCKAAGSSALQ